jgi:hypothetical protein
MVFFLHIPAGNTHALVCSGVSPLYPYRPPACCRRRTLVVVAVCTGDSDSPVHSCYLIIIARGCSGLLLYLNVASLCCKLHRGTLSQSELGLHLAERRSGLTPTLTPEVYYCVPLLMSRDSFFLLFATRRHLLSSLLVLSVVEAGTSCRLASLPCR